MLNHRARRVNTIRGCRRPENVCLAADPVLSSIRAVWHVQSERYGAFDRMTLDHVGNNHSDTIACYSCTTPLELVDDRDLW